MILQKPEKLTTQLTNRSIKQCSNLMSTSIQNIQNIYCKLSNNEDTILSDLKVNLWGFFLGNEYLEYDSRKVLCH